MYDIIIYIKLLSELLVCTSDVLNKRYREMQTDS